MKRFMSVTVIILGLILTGCGTVDSDVDLGYLNEQIASLNEQISALEIENAALLNEIEALAAGISADNTQMSTQEEEQPQPVEDPEIQEVTVVFVGKHNVVDNVRRDRVEFDITATNNTDRDIRGIQGVVEIQDLFGGTIMNLGVDLVGQTISPGETAFFDGMGIHINPFRANEVQLHTTDFQDLIFIYTVEQIIFVE